MGPRSHARHRWLSLLLISGAVAAAPIAACYTGPDVEQAYYGDRAGQEGGVVAASGCKPDIETIQKTVFLPRCATSGCHAGANPGGSLDLESHGPDTRLVGMPASECGGQVLVRPGDPDGSYLMNKLTSREPACGEAMPGMADSLADDDIACVAAWITSLSSSGPGDGGGDTGASNGCEPGLTSCGSQCVDTKVDPKNCGQCDNPCPVACADGACVTTCPAPTTNCSNACVDTTTSTANCGACGNKCPTGQICASSTCSCGSTVSFASQLQPILSGQCATTGCHTGNMAKAKLNLSSGMAYKELVGVASEACSGKVLVVAGAVDQSYLMNKLTGVGMCAGSVMPKAGGQLPGAQIDLFRTWICNGAPNN